MGYTIDGDCVVADRVRDDWKLVEPCLFYKNIFKINSFAHSRLIRYLRNDRYIDHTRFNLEEVCDHIYSYRNAMGYFGDKESYCIQLIGLYDGYIPDDSITAEQEELLSLEELAESSIPVVAGGALEEIYKNKLWRLVGSESWEDYCQDRWTVNHKPFDVLRGYYRKGIIDD